MNRVFFLVCGVVAVLVVSLVGQTPRAAGGAKGHADLSGIWQALGTANWNLEEHSASQGPLVVLGAAFSIPAGESVVEGKTIPYQESALAKRKENQANWLSRDPEIKCYLPGVPRATYMPYPLQIVQGTPNVVISYAFARASRNIHFEKEKNDTLNTQTDLWMGWSVGRWEGDTLVVDVKGFNDKTWLDRAGNFHSDELHVVERYTRTSPDVLMYEATLEDPKVYTRPWKLKVPLYRIDKQQVLLEYQCIPFVEELLYGQFYKK